MVLRIAGRNLVAVRQLPDPAKHLVWSNLKIETERLVSRWPQSAVALAWSANAASIVGSRNTQRQTQRRDDYRCLKSTTTACASVHVCSTA
jgi:hypothetical protein